MNIKGKMCSLVPSEAPSLTCDVFMAVLQAASTSRPAGAASWLMLVAIDGSSLSP